MLAKILDFILSGFLHNLHITGNLILATGVMVALYYVICAAVYYLEEKVPHHISCYILIFGGLPTIFLQNPAYIKLKVTVVNWVWPSSICLPICVRKNPLYTFSKEMPIPEHISSLNWPLHSCSILCSWVH